MDTLSVSLHLREDAYMQLLRERSFFWERKDLRGNSHGLLVVRKKEENND